MKTPFDCSRAKRLLVLAVLLIAVMVLPADKVWAGPGNPSPSGNAQGPRAEWAKTFGGSGNDWGCAVRQTADGGYVIAGVTTSSGAGADDVYLLKTDAAGNRVWQKTFGGSANDRGYAVCQTAGGGYIVAGETDSGGAGACDVYLLKTDSSGNLEWQKTFGGSDCDSGRSVLETADGGYIVAGGTNSFGAGACDVYLIKTDASGNRLWQRTFGGSGWDRGYSVYQTADGGYIIAGETDSGGAGGYDAYLLKTDASGNLEWQKTYGGEEDDFAYAVEQTADGGYIVAGETDSSGAGGFDAYLLKTDAFGNLKWQKTFGSKEDDRAYSVYQSLSGGYILAGETSAAGTDDVYLVKTDASGNLKWEKSFGGSASDYGRSVQQTPDGGYVIAGETNSYGAGGSDVYLFKLAPEAGETRSGGGGGGGGTGGLRPAPVIPGFFFIDMQGHWAEETVIGLTYRGIVSGYPDHTFRPDRVITRAEIAAILVRALRLEPGSREETVFQDSAAIPSWARNAVAAAVREGLVKGYPQRDGTVAFAPGRAISRTEMACITARVLEQRVGMIEPAQPGFTDAAGIPAWARAGVGIALAKGLISGYPDGSFRGDRPVTRAEAAVMIDRLLEKVAGS